jgi:hypothetical protein
MFCKTMKEINNAFRLGIKNHFREFHKGVEKNFEPIDHIFLTKELLDDLGACPKIWKAISKITLDSGTKFGYLKKWADVNSNPEYPLKQWINWFENAINKFRNYKMFWNKKNSIDDVFVTEKLLKDMGATPFMWEWLKQHYHMGSKWGVIKRVCFKSFGASELSRHIMGLNHYDDVDIHAYHHKAEWINWFETEYPKYINRSCKMEKHCCYCCRPCKEDIEKNIDYKEKYEEALIDIKELREKLGEIKNIMRDYC